MKSLPQASLLDGKVCAQCGLWQPFLKFGSRKSPKDRRDPKCRNCVSPAERKQLYMQQWRAENKEHQKAYKQQWRKDNPEKAKAADIRIYQRHRDKVLKRSREYALRDHEQYKQRMRDYAEANPTKSREANARRRERLGETFYEIERERAREWRKNNPEKRRAARNNSRARRKRQAEGKWTAEEFAAVCDHYGNVCLCCGKAKKLHADHVVPLIKGGRNDITNLQGLCHSCNSRKNVKDTDYRPDSGAFARSLKL